MIKQKCDNKEHGCERVFEFTDKSFVRKTIKVGDMFCKIVYFSCPYCGLKYLVSVENSEVRELYSDIKKIDKKLSRELKTQEDLSNHNNLIEQRKQYKDKLELVKRDLNKSVYPRL